MANIPQKSPDPTEQVLSTIQEALNASQPEVGPTPTPTPAEAERAPSQPPVVPDLFNEKQSSWDADEAPSRRAANDDRANVGQVLQAIHRRPTPLPYAIASVAAFLWVAGSFTTAYLFGEELHAILASPRTGIAAAVGLICAVVVPVVFFYVLAHMFRRTQDLRLVTETMAEAALRLAQPEAAANEEIVTVGQAIRREVAAMGDGVERALARAAELEALVHNEVSALERAYNDNEVRIRDLLNELSNQRETLVSQAEHVRNAIASVHLDLSHDITSVGDLVSDKVSEVAQRVTRSLTEKGEHITLALGHAGDSMIDTLTERGSTLLDRLETTGDRATTAISSASDRLTASLNFKTDHVHDEYADLTAKLQQMLSTRLDQVAQDFAQKATATIERMGSHSQQFNDSLAVTSGLMAQTITARAEEVNAAVRAAGDKLVNDLGLRGGDVISQLEQTGARVTASLVNRSDAVADSFRQNTESLVQMLNSRGEAVKEMLAARLQAFEDMLQQGGTALTEKVSRDTTTIGSLITRHLAEFDHTVKTYGAELVERLGQRTHEVSEAMRNYVDTFDQRVSGRAGELVGAIDARSSQFETTLATRVSDLTASMIKGGKEVIEALDGRISAVTGTINSRGTEVADAISAKMSQIDRTLSARALEIAETLDSRVSRFEDLLVGRAETATNQLESRTRAAAEALHERLEQLGQSIKSNSAEAERSLTQAGATTAEAMRTTASDVERVLLSVSAEVTKNFTGKTDEIADTVNQRTAEMTTLLSDKSGGVLATLSAKGQQFAADISKATNEAMKSIEDKGLAFTRTLLANSTEISRMISSAGETASNTVNRTLNDLNETAQKATDEAMKSIEDKGLAFTRALLANSTEISRMISSAGETASNTVDRTLNELNETAQKAIEQSNSTVSGTVTAMLETHKMLRADTTALFERLREANIMLQEVLSGSHANMAALENTLVLRVSEFVSAMNEVAGATGDVNARVECNIADFRDVTGRVIGDLGQLASRFDAYARGLAGAAEDLNRSNQRTENAVNERRVTLDSLVAALDTRTDDLDQRLKRFSSLLDETLESASGRAHEIARTVSESTAEGVRAISEQYERVRENAINERRVTLDSLVAGLDTRTDDLDQRFKRFSSLLDESLESASGRAHEIARTVSESTAEGVRAISEQYERVRENAINERRVTLDSLVAALDTRTEDLDQRLKRFSSLLDESLESASGRAREIARTVSESTAEGLRAISEQYEHVRENAEEERHRTTEAMRTIHDQTTADTHALFRDANQRFAEVVQGMKEMAAEMQRELEATRTELHRGIFKLPQETAESTAQMRRVIVDQIEALAELNRIVARHGRSLDAVEPRRASREDIPVATIVSRSEPPRSPTRADVGGFAPSARRGGTVTPNPEPADNTRTGSGWLTDLLSRASREDGEPQREKSQENARESNRDTLRVGEERAPRRSIESLDSLSIDIARMIDHDAAADLWDRYKRGERNVFTRRLYTLQGQQAFDEIRKKYRSDPEFKQTVDCYINEFERLLDEVAHDDRGQVVARTYLTSETGKVYTMLAHAAGRFD